MIAVAKQKRLNADAANFVLYPIIINMGPAISKIIAGSNKNQAS